MANELTQQKTTELVEALDNHGVGEILKPFTRQIHLFDSHVAGTMYLEDASVLSEIKPEDKLILRREESKFDEHAIVVLTQAGKKLGYVPEKDDPVFARLMDAGKCLAARIKRIEKNGSFTLIDIGIYLVDF